MTIRTMFLSIVCGAVVAGCAEKRPIISHGETVGHWISQLQSPDPKIRKKAVKALGHVGNADADALPAVLGLFDDPDVTVRAEAVLAVLNMDARPKEAIPALEKAGEDLDEKVRSYAAKALERIRGTQ